MKEAFKIAEENTKKKRSADKRQRDLKATLEPLEVRGRVLLKNLTERGDLVKFVLGIKDISNKRKQTRRWTSICSS